MIQSNINLQGIFSMKNIIIYIIIINIIGFIVMLIDKNRAKKNEWRIPEKTIFIITALGGSIGTITGMYLLRHKTKKIKFTIGLPMILILEIIGIIVIYIKNNFM